MNRPDIFWKVDLKKLEKHKIVKWISYTNVEKIEITGEKIQIRYQQLNEFNNLEKIYTSYYLSIKNQFDEIEITKQDKLEEVYDAIEEII